jgi:hypothetical protein
MRMAPPSPMPATDIGVAMIWVMKRM